MCESGGESTEVQALLDAVDGLLARPCGERSTEELKTEMLVLRGALNRLELGFARLAGELDAQLQAAYMAGEDMDWEDEQGVVFWLRHEARMSWRAAASAVRVGRMATQLPESTVALEERRIGFAHLGLLADVAYEASLSDTAAPFDEQPLLRKAETQTVTRFRRDCAHARHVSDAEAFLREEVRGTEERSLELQPGPGGLFLTGWLDGPGGASLRAALEPLARRQGREDDRERKRRLADALVELASHRQRAELQVTATMETLLGLKGAPAGELEFSPPVAAATVQRLACDAAISRVILGPESAVIDVGRVVRMPNAATRRALKVRDGGCVWPGCERSVSWTVPHHLIHWVHGGKTELDNLVLLCHRHHWLVHEGGWQLVRGRDRGVSAVPPVPDYFRQARAPDAVAAA